MAAALSGCAPNPPAEAARPQAVRTATVRVGPIRERLRYVGTVRPAREVQLAAELPGTLVERSLPEGARARAGQVLARVATPETAARVRRIEAERARAEAERTHACESFAVDEALGRGGDLAPARVDLGRKGCDASTAAVDAADAALAEARATSARAVEIAPFDGVVLDWLADEGQEVGPGRPVLRFGSEAQEVRVAVTERDARRLQPGSPALLEVDGAEWSAAVAAIGGQATGPARAVEVIVPVPAGRAWLPGTSIAVSFVTAEADGSAVPVGAVQAREGGARVWVVDGAALAPREVSTGPREDGWIAVSPDLPPDARVVVGGLDALDPARPVLAVDGGAR